MNDPPTRTTPAIGQGSRNGAGQANVNHHSPNGVSRRLSALDPRLLVQQVPFCDLIAAYASDDDRPFVRLPYDDGIGERWRFVCPRCGYYDAMSGGSAVQETEWLWHCWRCPFDGTRMLIERVVIEDRRMLDRLYTRVREIEAAS